jgi:hypothetical protein
VDRQLRELDLRSRTRAREVRGTLFDTNPDEVAPRRERKRLAAAARAERNDQKSRRRLEKVKARATQDLKRWVEESRTSPPSVSDGPTLSTEPSLLSPLSRGGDAYCPGQSL